MKEPIKKIGVYCAGISLLGAAASFAATVPGELKSNLFAGPDMVPSPAVICAAPTGEVFVGVDMQGSLGKREGKGKIVRLVDTDNDGVADLKTDYAVINNPRGLISLGDKLIVLHCTVKDGKPYNQQISVFTDADGDGIADGPAKPLVTGIGNPKFVQDRGADHCTNNIRLGIDGWIYVAVGDFGFIGAKGTDGKELDMFGGGVVRLRTDGSELETFVHGTRNVYDVTVDPFMNVFTRENTNDGIGWWVRFSHYIQSGEFGYPSLYTNFPEEMLPALGEYASGSGTGNLYFEEPQWPAKYNKQNFMADWGRSMVYIHRIKEDGASFTNEPEDFIGSPQVTDLDVDASGRLYLAAWAGAGYKGNPNKGYVDLVVPKDWKYVAFPKLSEQKEDKLISILASDSHTARTYASQELVSRNALSAVPALLKLANQSSASLESRVAAVYTLAQIKRVKALPDLVTLANDDKLREHAIRCMTDRLDIAQQADIALLNSALKDPNPRVQVAAVVALGRTGKLEAAKQLVALANPPSFTKAAVETVVGVKSIQISKQRRKLKLEADISNYKKLFLILNPEGPNDSDHAAWINPLVITKDGKTIDLTEEKWVSATSGLGEVQINKDCLGNPLADNAKGFGVHSPSIIEFEVPANAKTFKATGMFTDGANNQGTISFQIAPLAVKNKAAEKPHSTPNKAIILPHIARQALIALAAEDTVIAGLNGSDKATQAGALSTMKLMHSEKVVDALIAKANGTNELKAPIAEVLTRLHQKETVYDGSTWWSTRPDPHGPYFYPVDWSGTKKINAFLLNYVSSLSGDKKAAAITEIKRSRAYVKEWNPRPVVSTKVKKTIGNSAIEDIVLHLDKAKGKANKGAKIISQVGCVSCHNIKPGDLVKGPNLAKLGAMSKADLAESIIKPGATIAKSWVTLTTKDGAIHTGTIVSEDKKELTLHNIAGIPTKIEVANIKTREPGMNMMSMHLCDNLSLQDFADLVEYIQSMDKTRKKK